MFSEDHVDFLSNAIESFLNCLCHKPKFSCDVKTSGIPYDVYEYGVKSTAIRYMATVTVFYDE